MGLRQAGQEEVGVAAEMSLRSPLYHVGCLMLLSPGQRQAIIAASGECASYYAVK